MSSKDLGVKTRGKRSVSANESPASISRLRRKSGGTGASASETRIAASRKATDTFDFSSNESKHPQPLNDINVEKTPFGGVKFSKGSPTKAGQYAGLEKIAERRLNQSGTSTSSQKTPSRPIALASINTSGSYSLDISSDSQQSRKKRTGNIGNKSMNDAYTLNTSQSEGNKSGRKHVQMEQESMKNSTIPNKNLTSVSPKKNRIQLAYDKHLPSVTKSTDENYNVPELPPEEQMDIDIPKSEHNVLQAGARVLALWGNDYYAAYICGLDGLGRYYVLFAEDQLKRVIPQSGVIPISALIQGSIVSFITQQNGEEMGKVAEVVSQPSRDPEQWVKGMFELSSDEKKQTERVYWSKIYLTKEQGSVFTVKKMVVSAIEQENVVNESRSSRRSRSLKTQEVKTPTIPTPKVQGKRGPKPKSVLPKEDTNGTEEQETINEPLLEEPSPKKARPQNSVDAAIEESTTKTNGIKEASQEPIQHPSIQKKDEMVFKGLKFLLTSAPRANKTSDFNKREYRQKIEDRGGEIIDNFENLKDGESAFLIADTYYRTHKYLFALSLSVPCVSQKWISSCVERNELIDYHDFLLPAGESSLNSEIVSEWKPLKGKLLRNKKVMVYSNAPPVEDSNVIGFTDIWSPMLRNLGADLVEPFQAGLPLNEKISFIETNKLDILLTDCECEKQLAEKVETNGGLVVSSEFIIQAIIMGELPNITDSNRFRYAD